MPRASTVLDRTTGLAALVAVAAVVALPGWVPPWQGWLVLPLVALAGRYPLSLPTSSAESIVIGLDSSLLVLLGLSLPGRQALVLWAVALVAGELLTVKPLDTRVFNAGVATLSGGAALAVLSLVPQAARTSAAGLLVVVAAAAVYFIADYLWSAVSVAVAERTSPSPARCGRRGCCSASPASWRSTAWASSPRFVLDDPGPGRSSC